MRTVLDYYDIVDRCNPRSSIFSTKELVFESDIDCFEQFYKLNNSLKYCNGSYYKFQDPVWSTKYSEWLKSDDYKSKSFDLYYGKNGVVD
jgi:hypothetical protein